jgi:hypothetical protein
MIRANAAQNIGAVLYQELVIDLDRAAWLVLVFGRNQLDSLNEARGKTFAVRPRKPPLDLWSGSWKADTTRLL